MSPKPTPAAIRLAEEVHKCEELDKEAESLQKQLHEKREKIRELEATAKMGQAEAEALALGSPEQKMKGPAVDGDCMTSRAKDKEEATDLLPNRRETQNKESASDAGKKDERAVESEFFDEPSTHELATSLDSLALPEPEAK